MRQRGSNHQQIQQRPFDGRHGQTQHNGKAQHSGHPVERVGNRVGHLRHNQAAANVTEHGSTEDVNRSRVSVHNIVWRYENPQQRHEHERSVGEQRT